VHALPGGALATFPCKFGPQFFSALGGACAPSAPPGYSDAFFTGTECCGASTEVGYRLMLIHEADGRGTAVCIQGGPAKVRPTTFLMVTF